MSLIRQIWLLLLGTLLLALLASVSVNVSSARDTLQTQLRLKNSDNATAACSPRSASDGSGARSTRRWSRPPRCNAANT